jgi:hypothetical protein
VPLSSALLRGPSIGGTGIARSLSAGAVLAVVSRLPRLSKNRPPTNMAAPQIRKPTPQYYPPLAWHSLIDVTDAEQVMINPRRQAAGPVGRAPPEVWLARA